MQQGNYPFFTFSSKRSAECSDVAEHLDTLEPSEVANGDGHRVMSTFSITPQKSLASLSGSACVRVEPVLVPPPDHVVDDFVVLDIPASGSTESLQEV